MAEDGGHELLNSRDAQGTGFLMTNISVTSRAAPKHTTIQNHILYKKTLKICIDFVVLLTCQCVSVPWSEQAAYRSSSQNGVEKLA